MEIREYAELVLFSDNLKEKLVIPDQFSDLERGEARNYSQFPARPKNLRLNNAEKIKFPSIHELEDERTRGRVLHFFANHELMALELMALLLIKFPDAPLEFRRSIAFTMVDESKHVKLYNQRMEACGVDFGSIPVNDFFWRALSGLQTPMDYVTWLSLTFEQANLDFALHYKNVFGQLGDKETADVLEEVYEDEVDHVQNGLKWFNRWRKTGQSEWDAYIHYLTPELSPIRAKGQIFDRKSRERVGFSEDYINHLELFSYSRGRPPAVHLFEAMPENGIASEQPNREQAEILRQDLSILPLYKATHEDVVLVEKLPSEEFLYSLKEAGFQAPQFEEYKDSEGFEKHPLSQRKLGLISPWNWNAKSKAALKPLLKQTSLKQTTEKLGSDAFAQLFSDAFCTNLREEYLSGHKETQDWYSPITLKTPSASVFDCSFHFDLLPKGQLSFKGYNRRINSSNSLYRGSFLGRWTDGLPKDLLKFLYRSVDSKSCLEESFKQLARSIAKELAPFDYHGSVSFDACVYQNENGSYCLDPLIKLSPSWTMGRVALELKKHVQHGRSSVWLQLFKTDIEKAGFDSFSAYSDHLSKQYPIQLKSKTTQIQSGVFFTTDPHVASSVITLLSVEKSLESIQKQFGFGALDLT